MKSHAKLRAEMLKNPEVRREYDRIGPEFEIIHALIEARTRAGLTQAEVAERMGTTQSVIARMEGGRSIPNLKSLHRYAEATGRRLKLTLERARG